MADTIKPPAPVAPAPDPNEQDLLADLHDVRFDVEDIGDLLDVRDFARLYPGYGVAK